MKRWAILTVGFYLLVLLFLTVPVLVLCFGEFWGINKQQTISQAFSIYGSWGYWLWFGVMGLGQAMLLLVPMDVSERRLPSRRKLLVPILTSAFLMANLFIWGIFALLCAIFRDDALNVFNLYQKLLKVQEGTSNWLGLVTILLTFWIIWGLVFCRFAKKDGPIGLTTRATRWLLRGSILELLVAVPSHVVARNRDDCCAPVGTFWGIATGLSIMLLCFGPGVFFLFVERLQRLRPNREN